MQDKTHVWVSGTKASITVPAITVALAAIFLSLLALISQNAYPQMNTTGDQNLVQVYAIRKRGSWAL
jgi:hypothetical protein